MAGSASPGGRTGASGAGGQAETAGTGAGGQASGGASNSSGAGGGEAGSESGSAPPDIPRSTPTAALDETQRAALCDWNADLFGGYGHVRECGGTPVSTYPNQAECVANGFTGFCNEATAALYIDCATAGIPSNGCARGLDPCLRLRCM